MNENKQWPLMVNTLSAVMCFAMCGCATTSRDWKDAKCSGTIVAYEQFLERHPEAREAAEARSRLMELRAAQDWQKATSIDSIIAYQDYLAKYPSSKGSSQAKQQLERLEEERDWQAAKTADSIGTYREFVSKYSTSKYRAQANQQLEQMEADRDWQSAKASNTIAGYSGFVSKHPDSIFTKEAIGKYKELEAQRDWQEAKAKNTEDGWIEFIQQHIECKEVVDAAANLQTHALYAQGYIIPWDTIPSVYDERELIGEGVTCGVKMGAFKPYPRLVGCLPHTVVDGTRFFQPGGAVLRFEEWTMFDGYRVKGEATVSLRGLSFAPGDGVVIASRN